MTREDLSAMHIECAADAITHTADQVGEAAHATNNPTVRYLGQTAAEQMRNMCEEIELELTSPQDAETEIMCLYLSQIRSLEGSQVARCIGEGILMLGLAADLPTEEMQELWRTAKSTTRMERVSDERLLRGTQTFDVLAA